MGLITKKVEVKWHFRNKEWYMNKGYFFTKFRDEFIVKVEDLSKNSNVKVNVVCDCCNKKSETIWINYFRYVKEDGKYYCNKCAKKLYGNENSRKTRLYKNSSFEQWCIGNNRQDVLERWDYELNNYKPSEINYSTNKKYYFKCPKRIHSSELKRISDFTYVCEGSIECKQCNSFAQWGIDNVCKDFLETYWDNENIINPWDIGCCSNKRIRIKCQNKHYHGSYEISCLDFTMCQRCSYCSLTSGKVHPLDSLGKYLEDNNLLYLWSSKNKKSPYEYAPKSNKKVWWECPDGIHKDFYRSINSSNVFNFRCPECQYSKGEERISNYLLNKNINYIPQKSFNNLIGLGDGLLSYDFYLPQYNILIEYQGEQHEKPINFGKGTEFAKKQFKQQQEHDKRKREYAKLNNYNFLEIWYYDFNNVDLILQQELNIKGGVVN